MLSKINRKYALQQMHAILKYRKALLSLPFPSISDLAKSLNTSTNTLYRLYQEETGTPWQVDMPYHIIIRKTTVLDQYYGRGQKGMQRKKLTTVDDSGKL